VPCNHHPPLEAAKAGAGDSGELLGITTQADLEKYSLNKMKALAELPTHEQVTQFGRN